ncbi:MAG: helix-turn-helix domain-containing protein [Actinobacteria bacterium]|nr:helix-turn-helix domain-containing protein [Actinomycetota bacterium]
MAKYSTWQDVRKKRPVNQSELRKLTREYLSKSQNATLAEIRIALNITQKELAEIIGIDQSNVSRIERGPMNSTELRTLEAYVNALGGELEIRARIDNVSHKLIDSSYEKEISRRK